MARTLMLKALLIAATTATLKSLAPLQQGQEIGQLLARWSGGNIGRFSENDRARFMAYVEAKLVKKVERRNDYRWDSLIFENHGDAYVWARRSLPGKGYIVFLNPHTGMTPSAEHAWLFVVDLHGNVVKRSEFDTGWRMYAKHASYETVEWLSTPVLMQEMEVTSLGGGPRKIYFGFDGLRPAVIRLEDESGHLRPMDYFAPNFVVGPKYDPPTVKELEKALVGDNVVKRLEALVWLAGRHSLASENRAGRDHEATSEQRRYANCIKAAGIVNAIKRLRANSNPYVSKLAQRVPIGVGLFRHPLDL